MEMLDDHYLFAGSKKKKLLMLEGKGDSSSEWPLNVLLEKQSTF